MKFVVGNEPCSVPVNDRLSQYSCDEWNISVPGTSVSIRCQSDLAQMLKSLTLLHSTFGLFFRNFSVPVVLFFAFSALML